MQLKVELVIDTPYEVRGSKRELKEHIADAVKSWGKGGDPEHWLFDAIRSVKVGPIREVSDA